MTTKFKVAVDDGHGFGADFGAIAVDGTTEHSLNAAIKPYCVRHLLSLGMSVVDVNPVDAPQALHDRVRIANRAKADIYVSIHCNDDEHKCGQGFEVWRYQASKPGRVLALSILDALTEEFGPLFWNRGVKTSGANVPWVKRHPLVLRKTQMPAVIVECGFMHGFDLAQLKLDIVRERFGIGISNGIDQYRREL